MSITPSNKSFLDISDKSRDRSPGDTSTQTMESRYRVVLVDDDETMRYIISRVLKRCNCEVTAVHTPEDALKIIATVLPDLVFSDLRIPNSIGGGGLLDRLQRDYPAIALVLISCDLSHEARQEFLAKGAFDCLRKPFFEQECNDILTRLNHPELKAG